MAEREYLYEDQWAGYGQQNQDPNAQPLGENQQQQSGGGPQGADSQPQSNQQESQALDQALGGGGGGSSYSPVNANGSISTTYQPMNYSSQSTESTHDDPTLQPTYGNEGPGMVGGVPVGLAPGPVPVDPGIADVQGRWNGGSPPAIPLPVDAAGNATSGWEWNGWEWVQVPGRGLGFGQRNVGSALPAQTTTRPPTTGGQNQARNAGGGYSLPAGFQWSNFRGFNLPPGMTDPYGPQEIKQYTAPDQGRYENAALDALMAGLANSEWSGQRIAQMKEMQKEQALRMRQDLNREVGDRFAGMGRAGSGAQEALQRRGDEDTMAQILGAYRGVDQNAAAGRRDELLSTVGAIDSALSGQTGRSATGYNTYLGGAQARADELYRNWQSRMQLEAAALQRAIAEESARIDWRRTDLGLLDLLERGRQFNEGLGLDWTKMNLGIPR